MSSLTKMAFDYGGEPLVLQDHSAKMFSVIAEYINASAYDNTEPLDLSDLSMDGLQRLGREVCFLDLHDMARRVKNECQRRRRQEADAERSREDDYDRETRNGFHSGVFGEHAPPECYHKPCRSSGDAVMPRIGDHIIGKANSKQWYQRTGRIQSMSMQRMIYTAKSTWEDEFEGDYADSVCRGDIRWEDDGTVDNVCIWSQRDGQHYYYFQHDPDYPTGMSGMRDAYIGG
jgi:hypothetical protein